MSKPTSEGIRNLVLSNKAFPTKFIRKQLNNRRGFNYWCLVAKVLLIRLDKAIQDVSDTEHDLSQYMESNKKLLNVDIPALEARIDALMLEYYPDEMTPEQIENWGNHQIESPEEPNVLEILPYDNWGQLITRLREAEEQLKLANELLVNVKCIDGGCEEDKPCFWCTKRESIKEDMK